MFARKLLLILLMLALSFLVLSCGDDDDDDDNDDDSIDDDDSTSDDDDDDDDNDDDNDDNDDNDDDTDPGDAIVPSAGYLSRQAEYLAYCSDNGTSLHAQVCRVATEQTTYNQSAIDASCTKLANREDTSDFHMASILRILYIDRENGALPSNIRDQLKQTVLDFKYWLDEPGWDDMCWWSENHQILFHSAELLAGQLYKAETFTNSGMTGQDHIDHAIPYLERWLELRGRIGFVEFHSNVYFNEDIPALTNVADFSEVEEISTRAMMLLDTLAFDFANNYYKGLFATTHGRTYPSKLLVNMNDSTAEAAWVMLGIGDYSSTGDFSGSALSTSPKYWPPAVLEEIAADALEFNEHKERDSINLEEAADFGLGYSSHEDVMFWWGAGSYTAPPIVAGTLQYVEDYDLWDSWLWRDIDFLRFLVGSPFLEPLTGAFEEIARGSALEQVNTYTYRTPDYQLSGAQNFKPGYWGAQAHIWQATLASDAAVFTTYPGGLSDDYAGGSWTGGWFPKATFFENVGVLQYKRISIPILEALLFVDYTHAHFPVAGFDEVVESGNWTMGRKGDGYVALYSQNPVYWAANPPESEYELIADGKENVWIVEMGRAADDGTFNDFVTAIEAATITIDASGVSYQSPSQGLVEVSYDGPMTVDGTQIDIGPYPRWDNAYSTTPFDTNPTFIDFDGKSLELDFDMPRRRYWDPTS
jgi:hypothetical protein